MAQESNFTAVSVDGGLKEAMDADIAEMLAEFPARKKISYNEMIATYRTIWLQAKAENDA